MFSNTSLIGLILICFTMTSCSASNEGVKKNEDKIMIRGTVRVIGNEPFPSLVLTVQDSEGGKKQKDYLIKGPLAKNILNQYQGKVIVVEGTYCAEIAPERLPCIEPERVIKVE